MAASVDDSIDEASVDMTAVLTTGERVQVFVEHAIGSLQRPMSDADLDAKFHLMGDPVLGAIGGSYGGGYQFVGALSEVRDRGATRFDALVPEITWFSLTESLFPQGVPRTEWAAALLPERTPEETL